MFYKSTNFDLSNNAKEWVLEQYTSRFHKEFYHDLDIIPLLPNIQNTWQKSIVCDEINEFLKSYNLDISYQGITSFISNSNCWYIGNPHVDVKIDFDGSQYPIRTRFNILILGDSFDKMFWWKNFSWDDPKMEQTSFTSMTGHQYFSYCVPGNNPEERWDYLGKPTTEAINFLTPSAFVKTDCAHTVNVSVGRRLILTVAFDKDITEIIGP